MQKLKEREEWRKFKLLSQDATDLRIGPQPPSPRVSEAQTRVRKLYLEMMKVDKQGKGKINSTDPQ